MKVRPEDRILMLGLQKTLIVTILSHAIDLEAENEKRPAKSEHNELYPMGIPMSDLLYLSKISHDVYSR